MNKKWLLLLFLAPSLIGLGLALYVSWGSPVLPIDDAYILRQYVVNLANGNGWGFNPGELSFGSTSFLFPIFTAIPMIIFSGLSYEAVAYLFGIISFLALIMLVQWWVWRAGLGYLPSRD